MLGIDWSPLENLLIDTAILTKVQEEQEVTRPEEERTVRSLASEIEAKRRRWLYRI